MNINKIKPKKIGLGKLDKRDKYKDNDVSLYFDMNALAELEEKYGDITKALNNMSSGRISNIREMLYYGVKHSYLNELTGEYEITPTIVGSWFAFMDIADITKSMSLAFGAQVDDIEENEKYLEELQNDPNSNFAQLTPEEIAQKIEQRKKALQEKKI